MRRAITRVLGAACAATAFTLVPAAPANATVHEIVGQWCSGRGELLPPGLTGGSNANNFARPLTASGFETGVVPLDGGGFLVQFNYSNPNAKVVGTGVFVEIGQIDGQPLFLELITPDPDFPAFQRCPRLFTP